MAEHRNPLTQSENLAITGTLAQLKARLEEVGEVLAALHIDHALQCLDPENPINQQADLRGNPPT
jgi:hypothetical protein